MPSLPRYGSYPWQRKSYSHFAKDHTSVMYLRDLAWQILILLLLSWPNLMKSSTEYISDPELKKAYQAAVGSLMYAMTETRPDLAQAVSDVSRFAANPGVVHLKAIKRIFRCVNGTRDLSLVFEVLFDSGDLMTLTTSLSLPESTHNQHDVHIQNLYNEPDTSNSPVLDDLTSILYQTANAANNLPHAVITDLVIVGDFNIHHPSWGCKTTKADNWSSQLLEIVDEFNLTQHLPPGTTTYISPLGSESTIDLVITSSATSVRAVSLAQSPYPPNAATRTTRTTRTTTQHHHPT